MSNGKTTKRVIKQGGPRSTGSLDAHFGEKLRARRLMMVPKISQEDLGAALGITFQQIQKYEKAKNAVAPGRLRQMCEVLRVAPAEMFGGQPNVDGDPIPEMSRWSYRTLIALNKIKSESVKRSIGALIEEMAGSR